MKAIVSISIASFLLLVDVDGGYAQSSSRLCPCTGAYVAGDVDCSGWPYELTDLTEMMALYRGNR